MADDIKADPTPILWEGCCPVHDLVSSSVQEPIALHPKARVIVHPGCSPEVIFLADAYVCWRLI